MDHVHNLLLDFSTKYQSNNIYSISDPYKTKNLWKTFSNENDNLERLMKFHQWLENNPHFEYLDLNGQAIAVQNYSSPDKFATYYEEGSASGPFALEGNQYRSLKGAQFSKLVFSNFNLHLHSGRYFTDEEYNYHEDQPIPLILGFEYQEYYALGDKLIINFLGLRSQAQIVGFLEKDSHIFYRGDICYLDRRIIMPSLEFDHPPIGASIPEYLLRFYDVKSSGYILSRELNVDEAQVFINQICRELNLEPWWVNGSHVSRMDILHAEGLNFFALALTMSCITLLFSFISIILAILLKIKKNLRTYAVHLISGATVQNIKRLIGAEIIFYLLIANFLSAFISWRNFFYIGFNPLPPFLSFVLGAAALIIPFRQINHLNINAYLRGKR